MKSYVLISLMLLICSNGFGQPDKSRQKETGDKESGIKKYSEGASGVKRSISYRFVEGKHNTGTGKGSFCFDGENFSSINYVLADNLDLSGEDQTKWYSTWDDTTGATERGRITLVEYESENTVILDVKGLMVREQGFWKIPVEYVSGKMPTDGKIYYYVFSRIAHRKDKDLTSTEKIPATEPQKTSPEPQPVSPEQASVDEAHPVRQEQESPVIVPQQISQETKPIIAEPPQVLKVQETQVDQVITAPEPQITIPQQKPQAQVTEPVPVDPAATVTETPIVQAGPETPVVQAPSDNPEAYIDVKEDRRRPADRKNTQYQSTEDRLQQVSTVRQPVKEQNSETRTTNTTVQQGDNKAVTQPATKTQEPAAPKANVPAIPSTPKPSQSTKPKDNITSRPLGNQVSETSSVPPAYQPNLPSYTPVATQYSQGRSRGKCYSGIIEVGYGIGVGEYGIDNFRFNFINGFHIGPTFTMGLGLGLRRYFPDPSDSYLVQGKTHMPIFLDLREQFSTRTVTSYFALGLGNSAVLVNDGDTTRTEYEGLLLNPAGGIWINLSSRFAVFAGVAYELQKLEFAMISDNRRFKQNAGSFSFNVGISF
ncbi:MAG TPA: hypothetical protein VHO50_03035 [Bacteroidales bacterium]|nr:hypothetical protein [Bacteroidales bacterium]